MAARSDTPTCSNSEASGTPAVRTVPLAPHFPTDLFGDAIRAAVQLAAREPFAPLIHVALDGVGHTRVGQIPDNGYAGSGQIPRAGGNRAWGIMSQADISLLHPSFARDS